MPATITTLSDEPTAMTADALRELLACPRCDAPLADGGTAWRCAGCEVDFPHVAGIPWLFAEPNAALDEWRGRLHFSLQKLERERQQIAAALASHLAAAGDARAPRRPRARDARSRRALACVARAGRARAALGELRNLSRAAHAPAAGSGSHHLLSEHPSRLVLGRRGERRLVRDARRRAARRAAAPRARARRRRRPPRLRSAPADDSRRHGRTRFQSVAFDRRGHRRARPDDRAVRVPDRPTRRRSRAANALGACAGARGARLRARRRASAAVSARCIRHGRDAMARRHSPRALRRPLRARQRPARRRRQLAELRLAELPPRGSGGALRRSTSAARRSRRTASATSRSRNARYRT